MIGVDETCPRHSHARTTRGCRRRQDDSFVRPHPKFRQISPQSRHKHHQKISKILG